MTWKPKTLEEQIQNKCIHFNGVMNDCCDAGINYKSFPVKPSNGNLNLPCHQDNPPLNTCDKAEFLTQEQANDKAAQIRENMGAKLDQIASNICPNHNIAITKKQVGACVYADPCGCRLYQGKVA